jgi:cell division protein ZapD
MQQKTRPVGQPETQSKELDVCWFEQPSNEEVRICLRLEDLFTHLDQCLEDDSEHSSHAAIATISQLCNATDRNDLCSKLQKLTIQQLDRMQSYAKSPAIDLPKLQALMQRISHDMASLKQNTLKPGEQLRQNYFFNSIRHQVNSPNGLASFDSPQYCLWIRQSPERRRACLEGWLNDFIFLRRVVLSNLSLIRESRETKKVVTERGLFEYPMDKSRSCLLVRVKIDGEEGFYPTISVGKHQINIQLRSIEDVSNDLPQKSYAELPMTLHICYG